MLSGPLSIHVTSLSNFISCFHQAIQFSGSSLTVSISDLVSYFIIGVRPSRFAIFLTDLGTLYSLLLLIYIFALDSQYLWVSNSRRGTKVGH